MSPDDPPARRDEDEPPAERVTERLAVFGELQGEVMVFEPMAVREISRCGAQVETAFPLQLDSLHEFRLTHGNRSVIVKARVVHSRISDVDQEVVRYRSGIEFTEPPDHVALAIIEFIETVKDGRRRE